jgi:outer membrane lipoprotein carrier protein
MRALVLIAFLLPSVAWSSTIDELKALLAQTTTLRARFAQTVFDKSGRPLQESTGTMQFSRPGKFRWQYDKPFEQIIVGDGSRVWLYDKDLNQVTIRRFDRALGSSPAALLAGSNAIEKSYALSAAAARDGLEWLDAVPRDKDTAFESIQLGFGRSGLEAMELRDAFGQRTVLKFSAIERNPGMSPDAFRFTPPVGADVIRE